jgi:hypothetical protein
MDDCPVINKVEARQGSTKPGLRYVLIGGLLGRHRIFLRRQVRLAAKFCTTSF